jgi:hypothetical protein
MVAIEVLLTAVVLGVIGLLLLIGVAMLLGKRLHLHEWYRRDRRRLEQYRKHEEEFREARAEALEELAGKPPAQEAAGAVDETSPSQVIQQGREEEKR